MKKKFYDIEPNTTNKTRFQIVVFLLVCFVLPVLLCSLASASGTDIIDYAVDVETQIDPIINEILNNHGLTMEDCALNFYKALYDKLITDEFHCSYVKGVGPHQYAADDPTGKCIPMFSSPGVWNKDYVDNYILTFTTYWSTYSLENFRAYADARLAAETSQTTFDPTPHTKGKPVEVTGTALKRFVNEHSTYYEPTGSTNKVSWKTDKYFKDKNISQEYCTVLTFVESSYLFGIPGKRQLYAMPYVELNGETFYFNSCLYFDVKISGLEIYQVDFKGVNVFDTLADLKDPDVYSSLFEADESLLYSMTSNLNGAYAYLYIPSKYYYSDSTGFSFRFCDFATFSNQVTYGSNSFKFPSFRFYRSDNKTISADTFFGAQAHNFENGVRSEQDKDVDWGFIVSDTPILMDGMGADIDTTKIPNNYYITVSGDTIYDYSITNPETGQSSTVNEYITNNYTYITNNNPGGEGGGSGTTGGNVSVGGNVGVNGNVNVGGEVKFGGEVNVGVDVSPIDINVNVSGAGESGNGGGDPPEIGAVDDLVDYLPEKSPVINEYLKIFFDTLPPELLGLILAGVAVAVIKLIFRR